MFLFQILVNEKCTPSSKEAFNFSIFSSLQPSQETKEVPVIDNNGLKTQLSAAQDSGFDISKTKNLYRTTDGDSHKFTKRDVFNTKHGHYLDYPNKESVHKIENKQTYLENLTLPVAVQSKVYSALLTDPQKRLVDQPLNRGSDSTSENHIYNSKRAKCRTKRPNVKVSNDLKGDTRTRIRRSDEKKHDKYNMKNEHSVENWDSRAYTPVVLDVQRFNASDNSFPVINQVTPIDTNEAPVVSTYYPQYFVYTWVLCMVALASFLKLNYLVKTIVLVFMVTCYSILIIRFSSEISQCCG